MNKLNEASNTLNEKREVYVTKKPSEDIFSSSLKKLIKGTLGIDCTPKIYNYYSTSLLSDDAWDISKGTIFSERPVDLVYERDDFNRMKGNKKHIGIKRRDEIYDARADAVLKNLNLYSGLSHDVNVASVIVFEEDLREEDMKKIEDLIINISESEKVNPQEWDFDRKIYTLQSHRQFPDFNEIDINDDETLEKIIKDNEYVFNVDDLRLLFRYFREDEKRTPSILEIGLIDTYWSDHCRHTTFSTFIENLKVSGAPALVKDFKETNKGFMDVNGGEAPSLMDLALASKKLLESDPNFKGKLNMDSSREHNAASYEIDLELEDGTKERWIMMFKNETHNSPTQINPFGGAGTCLGGAIRDTMSGRAFTFQCMRISGSSDPRITDKGAHALSQYAISVGAAMGYSSYGNQIGLAAGLVREYFHPGYLAKRFECGYVVAAVNKENIRRVEPIAGDIVLMFGGRTGNDGVGGATTASATLSKFSDETVQNHVQKGCPIEQRKIQRLLLNPKFTELVKVSNDFGAGGVSVALGELSRGVTINLDAVAEHTKCKGLNDEIMTLSESQERMAIVIAPENRELALQMIEDCDLEGYQVGIITDNKDNKEEDRLIIKYQGIDVVNIKRDFIETNGATRYTDAHAVLSDIDYFSRIDREVKEYLQAGEIENAIVTYLSTLKTASQKGLGSIFDSSVGASSILAMFGGLYGNSPQVAGVSKIPTFTGIDALTASISAASYCPDLLSQNTYIGGMYSVIETISACTAVGTRPSDIWLSLQEYFGKLRTEEKWGEVYGALLGAYKVMTKLGVMGIGGKDSMSGTGEDDKKNMIDVPPTLVTFGNSASVTSDRIVSAEFKKSGSLIVLLRVKKDENGLPDLEDYANKLKIVEGLMDEGRVLSSSKVSQSGLLCALANLSLGNKIGFEIEGNVELESLFYSSIGDIILEIEPDSSLKLEEAGIEIIGHTTDDESIMIRDTIISIDKLEATMDATLEGVFPTRQLSGSVEAIPRYTAGPKIITENVRQAYYEIIEEGWYKKGIGSLIGREDRDRAILSEINTMTPIAIIPIFPGTNSELDTRHALLKAGFSVLEHQFYTPKLGLGRDAEENARACESRREFADLLTKSNMIVFPGGFSGGDEPDGSAKYIANMMRSKEIREPLQGFLDDKTKLVLGICNGFQALIKLGLFKDAKINDYLGENDPTLTFNNNARHITGYPHIQLVSNLSPFVGGLPINSEFTLPVSHGEGRVLIPDKKTLLEFIENGQIPLQYVDEHGNPTNKYNGSESGIVSLSDPLGRVLGLMPHIERGGINVAKNIPGNHDLPILRYAFAFFRAINEQKMIDEALKIIDNH